MHLWRQKQLLESLLCPIRKKKINVKIAYAPFLRSVMLVNVLLVNVAEMCSI